MFSNARRRAHCKSLGVEPDWNVWEQEDWAQDEAVDWTPGSPYPLWRWAMKAEDEDEAEPPGTDPPR